jgi:hypothetical protein
MRHLNFEQLLDYLENNLNTEEKAAVQTHLATCTTCQHELQTVRQTLEGMQRDSLKSPSSRLLRSTVAAFRHKQIRSAQLPRSVLTPDFDSRAKNTPRGQRSLSLSQEHQLLYSVNDGAYDVDLQIVKDSVLDAYMLRGQILGNELHLTELEGLELQLLGPEGMKRRGLTDELGRFSFSLLSEGSYSLQIIFDDREVYLEALDVK